MDYKERLARIEMLHKVLLDNLKRHEEKNAREGFSIEQFEQAYEEMEGYALVFKKVR
ncbi:MAG: hypothetical protein QXR58_03060 [Candidatus Micrarchaeaceae archaeon]